MFVLYLTLNSQIKPHSSKVSVDSVGLWCFRLSVASLESLQWKRDKYVSLYFILLYSETESVYGWWQSMVCSLCWKLRCETSTELFVQGRPSVTRYRTFHSAMGERGLVLRTASIQFPPLYKDHWYSWTLVLNSTYHVFSWRLTPDGLQ